MGWWRCLGGLKRRIRKVPSESNVKSYGAGKALSLRGWKAKKVTELKSMLTRMGLQSSRSVVFELFIEPSKYNIYSV